MTEEEFAVLEQEAMAAIAPLREFDPKLWWKEIQHTLSWLDQQREVPRGSKEGCLRAQQALLERWEGYRRPANSKQ